MTARDLAHRAFWTDHPLCALFAIANGRWTERGFEPARSWSIKQLIQFAEQLPQPVIERIGGTHEQA